MLRFLFVTLLVVFTSLSHTQNTSSIDFIIKNLGVNVDGHFNTFDIDAEFNTASELLSISGKITVSSIKTGIESRDEHLLKEDYFDVENHEFITLNSTSISKESDSEYSVDAILTIKGKTKEITIPVTVLNVNNKHKIMASFEINRRDFDVGGGSLIMSKNVKIKVTHSQDIE
ncbi:YceI family protein [Winogradskyella sp.]|uniref:YceI family protein n=1 Tax=Winogradskyella sp. TaxID=1883156 RepID=UPI00260401F4|nr:YceI family protein [Winogradskyella sp.]